MASTTLAATLLIGFELGLWHALDVDYVTAVSTLVSREQQWGRSARTGAVWGLGHTATLLLMGLLVIILGVRVPESWSVWLQGAGAAMLIFLGAPCGNGGAATLTSARTNTTTGTATRTFTKRANTLAPTSRVWAGRGSFAIGMVHGLSGSAN